MSVCIRAYDRPAGLAAAIDSVLAQTYSDFELVVSDDSASLAAVVSRFADARVRYHANPAPAGPAANLKRAFGLARGELLGTLNDDDRWHPLFLERTVEHFDRDSELGVVFTDYEYEVAGRRVGHRFPYAPGRHDRFVRELLEHSIPVSGNVVARSVWETGERSLPLRADMVGDLTTSLRAASAGYPFYFVPERLTVMSVHPGQLSWSEQALPSRVISTLQQFRFDDPLCERLRRARLAESYLARAHRELRRHRLAAALGDARRARQTGHPARWWRTALALTGLPSATMRWGSAHPRTLALALRLWRRVRPAVLRPGAQGQ